MFSLLRRLFRASRISGFPRCGKCVQYQQTPQTPGIFRFLSSDCADYLRDELAEFPHLKYTEDPVMLDWFEARDESSEQVLSIPAEWRRFKYIAETLIRKHRCRAFCTYCGFEQDDLVPAHVGRLVGSGWARELFLCPQNHKLLDIETIHFLVRPTTGGIQGGPTS
jgi:hypothetical protein